MPRPPRKYTAECQECGETFHPHHRQQACCSRSCGAARSSRLSEKRRMAWVNASMKARRPKLIASLRNELLQCKTLGDAYRLGYTKGYRCGWQKRDRRKVA